VIIRRPGFAGLLLAGFLLLCAGATSAQVESPIVPVKTEVQAIAGVSFGNIHIFGNSDDRQLYTFGAEYDRHCLGRLIRSQVDYVAELLPVVLLNEPAKYDKYGQKLTTDRQIVYGAGFTPVGARLMWRRPGQIQPYLIGKGGILYFENRVLSSEGTHVQFSAEFGTGVQKALTNRIGFRLAYNDFHFSNGNIGQHNPGIDFMQAQAGLTWRLGGW
jgi:opacity protein-like surface antigen